MRKVSREKRVPSSALILFIAGIGILSFLAISSAAPLRSGLFSFLFPKPSSQAATSVSVTSGVDIHLASSDDGGNTWNFQGVLWPSHPDTDKGGDNSVGETDYEVSNILPVAVNNQVTWYGARWAYFVPQVGGHDAVPANSRRLLISQAATPSGLATADSATLGASLTSPAWGIDTDLSQLSPDVSNCTMLVEPALYYESGTLYLTLACFSGSIKIVVFSTQPQGNIHTWQWHYRGTLAGPTEAAQLGGDGLTQIDIFKGGDGALLAVMSPSFIGTGAAGVLNHIGCKVVEIQSLSTPLLAKDASGNLKVRAYISASDLAPIGPGACTYDPASSTGIIITRRVNDPSTFTAALHRTSIKVDSSTLNPTFDCVADSSLCPELVINGDPISSLPNGVVAPFHGYADPSIRKDPTSSRLWMSYSWPNTHIVSPTPTPSPSSSPVITPTPSPSPTLPWLTTSGNKIIDASTGATHILKGFVTITGYNSGPLTYTLQDYQKMKALGANMQSIRITMGALGYGKGNVPTAGYITKLKNMVSLAEQVGMYTDFKLTTYDVPAFNDPSTSAQSWTDFWNNTGSTQDQIVSAWQNLWSQFINDPGVVGYDLFNEPQQGNIVATNDQFVAQYLTPFYQKIIDSLRQTDPKHLAFFQRPLSQSYPPYNTNISRPLTVYTAHFYPNFPNYVTSGDLSTSSYASLVNRFIADAAVSNDPLYIGEYGMPWDPANDGNSTKQAEYKVLEQTATDLFNQNNLSYTRPWYADDDATSTATIGSQQYNVNWALIIGSSGLSGPLRTFITDIFTAGATPSPSSTPIVTPTPKITPTATPQITPTPSLSPTIAPTITPTPTPTVLVGDLNNSGKVDIFDLSILLSYWNTNNTSADLNHDGTVNIFDLSLMLSHWS